MRGKSKTIGAIAVLALLLLAAPAQATFPGQNGRIAFSSHSASLNSIAIYTMNPNGSDVRLIGRGDEPDWSPDGTRIAFADLDGDDYEIFVMNADGSNRTQVTNNWDTCIGDCSSTTRLTIRNPHGHQTEQGSRSKVIVAVWSRRVHRIR